MAFSSNVNHWGDAVLEHRTNNTDTCLFYVEQDLIRNGTDEKTIKKIVNDYKLIFCNHFVQISHFINFISINRLAANQKDDFFYYLFLYIKQFYPDFDFLKGINNVADLITFFNKCYKRVEDLLSQFLDDYNFDCVKKNIELLNRIFEFYSIVVEFMIRFYGYSIVGIQNQQHIITACSNCDKKFIEYLMKGYSLFRFQKIGLVGSRDGINLPYYEFFPVLPTKDVGFPIDEYIEVSSDDGKMENMRMVKLLKQDN